MMFLLVQIQIQQMQKIAVHLPISSVYKYSLPYVYKLQLVSLKTTNFISIFPSRSPLEMTTITGRTYITSLVNCALIFVNSLLCIYGILVNQTFVVQLFSPYNFLCVNILFNKINHILPKLLVIAYHLVFTLSQLVAKLPFRNLFI